MRLRGAARLHERAAAAARVIERLAHRLIDDAQHWLAVDAEADVHGEVTGLRQEVARPVERIDDPDAALAEPHRIVRRLFGEERVARGTRVRRPIEDQRVGRPVGDGHRRRVGLGVERELGVAVVAQDDPTRVAGGLAGDFVLPIEIAHPALG